MIRFIIPLLFLFFSSLSFAEGSDECVQSFGRINCRTAYSDAGVSTKLARGAGHVYCGSGSYDACSGLIHYCGQSLSTTVNAPSTVGLFVYARWSAYKVWDKQEQKWQTCTLAFQGGEGDLTPVYNEPATEENCLSRPDIDASLSGVYKDDEGNKYVTVNGCIYEATGVGVCTDDETTCHAIWKPVTVDSSDVDNGSSDDSSSSGSSSSGSSSGSSSSGSSSGSSSSGSSSGDSSSDSILGWLQNIWASVNDLNSFFSLSQDDLNNSLNTFDGQLADIVNGDDEDSTDDYDSLASVFIDKLPKDWLFIDFDKLFFSAGQSRSVGARPLEVNFSFSLPVIGEVNFSIDTTDFSSVYDYEIRPIVEYALYLFTMLRVYFVFRRSLLRNSEL
ncbi:Phage Coat Protein A [Escherichia coli]|uniref:hypothetical protein n=1 Tax=Escherichia coli TaxID=562 RepID=UPI00191A16FD|nr:hypothetical protein [Escherichia coli]CAD6140024.1 Phage Coat Protein A [Escherichia coli]